MLLPVITDARLAAKTGLPQVRVGLVAQTCLATKFSLSKYHEHGVASSFAIYSPRTRTACHLSLRLGSEHCCKRTWHCACSIRELGGSTMTFASVGPASLCPSTL